MRDCLTKAVLRKLSLDLLSASTSSSDLTEVLPLKMSMSLAALAAVMNSSHFLKMSVVKSDLLIMN